MEFKKFLKDCMKAVKKPVDIVSIVVDIVVLVAMIPIIKTFVASAENLTTTETTLLGLVSLFLILGAVFVTVKRSGLKSK